MDHRLLFYPNSINHYLTLVPIISLSLSLSLSLSYKLTRLLPIIMRHVALSPSFTFFLCLSLSFFRLVAHNKYKTPPQEGGAHSPMESILASHQAALGLNLSISYFPRNKGKVDVAEFSNGTQCTIKAK